MEPVRNPMLNQVVLTRLFELCDLADLPSFRLVSKQWYANSLTRFRNEMIVTFDCGSLGYTLEREYNLGQKFLLWKSFLENLEVAEDNPFNSFRIKYIRLRPRPSLWNSLDKPANKMYKKINRFWNCYGSWIRKLELWHPVVQRVGSFKKVIFHATPNLEELHLIEIENKSGYDPDEWEEDEEEYVRLKVQPNLKRLVVKRPSTLPITWKLVFSHFPNIQNYELTFTSNDSWSIRALLGHFAEISKIVKNKPVKFTVTSLGVNLWHRAVPGPFPTMDLLQLPQLILSNISLDIRNCDREDGMNLFSALFLHHGDTLKEVHVITGTGTGARASLNQLTGPFNLMTKLKLTGNCCKNLHFLAQFPNLKFLDMAQSDEKILEETDSERMETVKLHKLQHFRLSFDKNLHIPQEAMEMLVKVMPNLETFYGKVSNESLRVVCRGWRQLRSLIIGTVGNGPEAFLNNEGITGVVEGCEERLPNIADLKDLNYLRIKKEDGLTEASGREKVVEMLHRQRVSLGPLELKVEGRESASQSVGRQFPFSSRRSFVLLKEEEVPVPISYQNLLSDRIRYNIGDYDYTLRPTFPIISEYEIIFNEWQDKRALEDLTKWVRTQNQTTKRPPFFVPKPAKNFREFRTKSRISKKNH